MDNHKQDYLVMNEESRNSAIKSFQKQIPNLTLMDDYYLMLYAKRYPEDFSMILSEFIQKDVEIDRDTFQIQPVVISPDDAKDIRLDITVSSKNGDRIVLEVESKKKFGELRLRYYMAKQDSNLLKRGETYNNLPDSYNIVVARHDIKGDGKPRYVMRMCYVESLDKIGRNPAFVKDGRAAIYINASYRNKDDFSPLANLIHDFKCRNPEDIRNETIKTHSKILKNTKEGQDYMTSEILSTVDRLPLFAGKLLTYEERMEERAEGRAEGREEGREQGEMNAYTNILLRALKSGNRDMVIFAMEQFLDLEGFNKEKCIEYAKDIAKKHNLELPQGILPKLKRQ